jgi:predicted secreted protein
LADKGEESVAKFVRSRYDPPKNQVVGAAGTAVFTFKAHAAGVSRIRLEYARPWEKNTPPAKERTVDVQVHQPKR